MLADLDLPCQELVLVDAATAVPSGWPATRKLCAMYLEADFTPTIHGS